MSLGLEEFAADLFPGNRGGGITLVLCQASVELGLLLIRTGIKASSCESSRLSQRARAISTRSAGGSFSSSSKEWEP